MHHLSAKISIFILFFISGVSLAETIQTGDWTVDYTDTFSEAYTENAAGKSIGFWCDTKENNCFFYLRTNTACKENSTTVIPAKTDAGETEIELLCRKIAHDGDFHYLYFFTDTERTRILLEERLYIEISLPDMGTETFSLKGSKRSIRKVDELAGK